MNIKIFNEILQNIQNTVTKHGMLDNVQKVVVGFSGGADSTALLHFLYYFASEKGKKFEVVAVHVNHGLRGAEAQRDEDFVRDFCKKNNINLVVEKIDVYKLSKDSKTGLEEAGRNARYKIFNSVAIGDGLNKNFKIATAHTLSDNCETVIFNLARGTSLKGLCGIPCKRENIIRPLIDISREEVEKYCCFNNLKYINDSTNFEKDYNRNKIRLSVIPELKKINPDFEKTVKRALVSLNQDENYLDLKSQEVFESLKTKIRNEYNIKNLHGVPDPIQNRVIIKIIKSYIDKPVEQRHIYLVKKLLKNNIPVTLPNKTLLICENYILKEKDFSDNIFWEYPFNTTTFLTEIKTNIIIKVISFSKYLEMKSKVNSKNVLDFDKIPLKSVIRNRRAGDKFTFSKRNLTKSLKKLMNELKIPQNMRNKIPVLAFQNEVIWMDTVGVSKKYKPTENTKNIAVIYKESKI